MIYAKPKMRFTVLIIALIVIMLFTACDIGDRMPKHTTDIELYGSEKYPIRHIDIMPDEIPDYAAGVKFSYYNYYDEDFDIFLEMSFHTSEDMNKYLLYIKETYLRKLSNDSGTINKSLCFEDFYLSEQNPYNESYTDMICTRYAIHSGNNSYTGYDIRNISEATYYCDIYFGVISYSYSELKVINSYCYGDFDLSENGYKPKYIELFDIPTDIAHKRHYEVQSAITE